MRDTQEREVYEKADEALAHANSLADTLGVDETHPVANNVEVIRHNLEIIRRRTDPAVGPGRDGD